MSLKLTIRNFTLGLIWLTADEIFEMLDEFITGELVNVQAVQFIDLGLTYIL